MHRNLHRLLAGFLVLASLLVLLPTPTTAFTWTALTGDCDASTTKCLYGAQTFTWGTNLYGTQITTGLPATRGCSEASGACGDVSSLAGFQQTSGIGFTGTSTQAAICSIANPEVEFSRTTGSLWTVASTVDATTAPTACGVAYEGDNSGKYMVVYDDAATHSLTAAVSTNNGATWTNVATAIETNAIKAQGTGTHTLMELVSPAANTWVFLYAVGATPGVGTENSMRSCKSTNDGVAWTCQAVSSATVTAIALEIVSSTRIVAAFTQGTNVNFLISDDAGTTWGVLGLATGTTQDVQLAIIGEQEYILAHANSGTLGGASQTITFWHTETGGESASEWTSSTDTATTNQFCSGGYLWLGVDSTGDAVWQYAFTSDNGCFTPQARSRAKVASIFDVASALDSTATVAVTDLVAMDVDHTGNTVIARTGDGASTDSARTYEGATLAPLGSDDTRCSRTEGVAALSEHVAYFQCDENDSSNVIFLSIKSRIMGTPDTPELCSGAGFCIENIGAAELAGAQDDQYGLASVNEYRFDYTVNQDFGGLIIPEGSVWMAFGVTQYGGRAGILTYTMNNNADDHSDLDTISVGGASTIPQQICVVQDASDGQSWFYASASDANVKAARIDFTQTGSGTVTGALDVTLTETFSGTASTANPYGIACGEGRFAILNANKVTLWQRGASSPYFTQTGLTSVPYEGIHMSADGEWLAYISNGQFHVIAMDNGTEYATGTLPTGTFKDVRLQGHGSTIWIATNTQIAVYAELYQLTTGQDEAYLPPGAGATSTSTPTSDPNNQAGGVLSVGLVPDGWTVSAFNGFLGIVVMAAITAGFYFILGRSMVAAVIGAISGFFLSYFLGLFGLWLVIVIGVIATAIVFIKIRSSVTTGA